MKPKTLLTIALAVLLLLAAGCSAQPTESELTVFAAASLTESFTEIGQEFEASHPGVTVVLNFAGSQTLRTQLEEGAQADVFASANVKHMDGVVEAGLVESGSQQIFVHNQLVLLLPEDNPANIQSLEDLTQPGLKLVLAAPDVPVGGYSLQALESLDGLYGDGYSEAVLANLVSSEENVKLVVAKVQLGEADAGIVYGSDAQAVSELPILPIPADYNPRADYPIAMLNESAQPETAQQFVDYVLSEDGQAILASWGFVPVTE